MKPLSLFGLALAVVLSLSACDPKTRKSKDKPAAGTTPPPAGLSANNPTIDPNAPNTPRDPVTPGPGPTNPVIPDPPKPGVKQVEYAIKIEGRPGYVKSPYDDKGRPIDVRGLPSGTEVEDPYNQNRTLLVP
jgi:hypothetical protein